MGKRQRTPHFIKGLGDGHVGRDNSGQKGQQGTGAGSSAHLAGFHQPPTDDIFHAHIRRNTNTRGNNNNIDANPNHYRLRAKDERLVRNEVEDGRDSSRWDLMFTSSSRDRGGISSSGFSHPMDSSEQWQMSAIALVGMVVFLSALFLHLVSDSATASAGGGSYAHNYHNMSAARVKRSKNKRKTSNDLKTRRKKTDEWSSDESASEGDTPGDPMIHRVDSISEGQGSTITPNINAATTASVGGGTKQALFYPYQPRHRKPSVNGYKEAFGGGTYSPSAASSTAGSGFHSRNYYLPSDGRVMVPSYQSPTSATNKHVRLASPNPYQNTNTPARSKHPDSNPKNFNIIEGRSPTATKIALSLSTSASVANPAVSPAQQKRALEDEFVATALQSFHTGQEGTNTNVEISSGNYAGTRTPQGQRQLHYVGTPRAVIKNSIGVNDDDDEESQQQNAGATSTSAGLVTHASQRQLQPPVMSPVAALNRRPSYTHADNQPYTAYGQTLAGNNYESGATLSFDENIGSTDSQNRQQHELSGSNTMLNDSTHHHANLVGSASYHQRSSRESFASNNSSQHAGMLSPRVDLDISEMEETPRAGLTRRMVDVMGTTPRAGQNTKSAYDVFSAAQRRQHQATYGQQQQQQQQQQPELQNGNANSDSSSNDRFYSLRLPSTSAMGVAQTPPPRAMHRGSASPQQQLPQAQPGVIPFIPALDPTSRERDQTASLESSRGTSTAPQSIAVEELHLVQMESGSAPHWQVANSAEMKQGIHQKKESSSPFGPAADLFSAASVSSHNEFASEDDNSEYANDPRNSIIHKRPTLTDSTDAASSLRSSIKFSELTLKEVIGGGGFGQVWRAVWNGTPVAVKVLTGSAQAKHVSKAILEEFAAEINLLSGMRHPNICLYMGACVDPPNRAIITELASNGSLWDALRLPLNPPYRASDGISHDSWPMILYHPGRHGTPPTSVGSASPTVPPIGSWPWALVKRVACGAARGMAYLHNGQPPILHRDLKSANVLLDEAYTPKICDFGLSRLKAQERSMTGNCGTVQWMAPEILSSQSYNEKADIYSYGIILTELLTRECPYEGMSAIQCALAVLNRDQRPPVPKWCPPSLRALVSSCVKKNPNERPTFGEIINVLDAMP